MKLQVMPEACTKGRILTIFFPSLSVSPHLHTPITLWFIDILVPPLLRPLVKEFLLLLVSLSAALQI